MPITKTVTSLAVLALLASAIAPTRAIGGNPKAHRSSSVLLGNGMHVDLSRTPSPLATSLVFSGADALGQRLDRRGDARREEDTRLTLAAIAHRPQRT